MDKGTEREGGSLRSILPTELTGVEVDAVTVGEASTGENVFSAHTNQPARNASGLL